MPFAICDGRRIYWKLEGLETAPPLVLLNSIGTDMDLWDAMLPYLRSTYHLLRIDTRGHGASDVGAGDYALSGLAEDVFAAMDDAGIAKAAVAGVSLGGMMAMEMALARPDRISALALICTSVTMDPAAWEARVGAVRSAGTASIADLAIERFLSPDFASCKPDVAATIRRGVIATPDDGYAGCASAIRDMDLADRIGSIACPTLVVTGREDISTPLEGHGDAILSRIPGARHAAVSGAHLPPVEAPGELVTVIDDLLQG